MPKSFAKRVSVKKVTSKGCAGCKKKVKSIPKPKKK